MSICKAEQRYTGNPCGLPKPHDGPHAWEGQLNDEMLLERREERLEAVAARLREDVEKIMLACLDSDVWLTQLYEASKGTGLIVLPRQR